MEKIKSAKRESKTIEFKERFDVDSARDWAEIIKDIVALANSGGGAILFGVRNDGSQSDFDPARLLSLDSAQVTDKIAKYTGEQFSQFSIEEITRGVGKIAALVISGVNVPIAFNREGNFQTAEGAEKLAFLKGTVYFRHGAKSEPATTNDLRQAIERELERIRVEWMGGIRKVMEAPPGSQVHVVGPGAIREASEVRLTNRPEAIPVQRLSPDQTHPFRLKETTELIKKILGEGMSVNSYDIQCVRKVYGIDGQSLYFYQPKYGSPQYSVALVDWLVAQVKSDPEFFKNCRRGVRAKRTD